MAGFALNDGLRNQQLKQLVVSKADIKKLLILPCTSQRSVLIDAINAARVCKIDGCVLSKVDEITSLGEVLSLVVEKQLPLAYITNGQTIPDDIELAQATALIEQTCGKHFNTPNITESVEDQLAGGMAKNIKQPLNPTQHSVSARL
jgi:flagellar biosynthesis protein FlhF